MFEMLLVGRRSRRKSFEHVRTGFDAQRRTVRERSAAINDVEVKWNSFRMT